MTERAKPCAPFDAARPQYAAHSPNQEGRWQPMDEHEANVAGLAEAFAAKFNAGELGRVLGLLHDAGKYHDDFQRYLDECVAAKAAGSPGPRRGPDHKSAGAIWLQQLDPEFAQYLAPIVLGHHGGIPEQGTLDNLAGNQDLQEFHQASLQRARTRHVGLRVPLAVPATERLQSEQQWEMFIRFVFSCLVDADALDTEQHFDASKAARRTDPPAFTNLLRELHRHVAELIERARGKASPVNRVRREVYEACREGAKLAPGVFRLTVPTGGGKTLASLAFALEHAVRHPVDGVNRHIIYGIPFTSIIEQTAGVFREVFQDQAAVLEHHSAIPEPEDPSGRQQEAEIRRRLAAENWDAAIIVTTTVQLFESLFSNRPGRCRKLHRIAHSIIVLDEVQTLPLGLLKPILDCLTELVEGYGVTVVLCTATQPALDGRSTYLKGLPDVRDIVAAPEEHFRALQRVNYTISPERWGWARVAEEMRLPKRRQCLTVVNTRRDAINLWRALDDPDAIFLSTFLCAAHRRRALSEIRARLNAGLPCRVVSTQLIEAGVDVSFPTVFRAIGPFDRIIQAAGRCNRESELPGKGEVIVFFPSEGGLPRGAYLVATREAEALLAEGKTDFDDPETYTRYYRRLIQDLGGQTDAPGIQALRGTLQFPEVAHRFRMVDDVSVPVVVPYDPYAYSRIRVAAGLRPLARAEWQLVQQHTVGIARSDFKRLRLLMIERCPPLPMPDADTGARRLGHAIEEWIPDTLYAWIGGYDPLVGFTGTDSDPLDPLVC